MDVSEIHGTPKSSILIGPNRVFQYEPSILGYHYFWKHPYAGRKNRHPPVSCCHQPVLFMWKLFRVRHTFLSLATGLLAKKNRDHQITNFGTITANHLPFNSQDWSTYSPLTYPPPELLDFWLWWKSAGLKITVTQNARQAGFFDSGFVVQGFIFLHLVFMLPQRFSKRARSRRAGTPQS